MTQPLRTLYRVLACALVWAGCASDPAPGAPDTPPKEPSERIPQVGAARAGTNNDDDEDGSGSEMDAGSPPAGDATVPASGADGGTDAGGAFGAFNDASLGLLDAGTLSPGFNEAGASEAGAVEAGPRDASAEGG